MRDEGAAEPLIPTAEVQPTAASAPGPTPAAERLEVLDVLRGLALYGVLLANAVVWFSGRAFMPRGPQSPQLGALDRTFMLLFGIFVDGKAMSLLTFLFGLGFALQLQRAEAAGRTVATTHLRRLAALTLIGVCHVLLLWWGDILWGYAIAGVGLLLFRRMKGRKVLLWALVLVVVPHFLATIPVIAKALRPITPAPADFDAFRAQVLAAITDHNRRLLTQMQVKQAYYHVGSFWLPYFPGLVGRFLFGYWAGMSKLFERTEERLPFFRKLAAWGIGLGLLGSVIVPVFRLLSFYKLVSLSESLRMKVVVPSELGTLLLAYGYAAAVVLLLHRPVARRLLRRIAPVGQMALTTYLMQSLICTFLFYGWGLGLIAHVQAARVLPLTLAVFTLQVLFARAWLSRFRFGPMEWLWRSLTYGRMQPMSIVRPPTLPARS